MMQPREMENISITGPQSKLDYTIRQLHHLGVLDIEEYDGDHEDFEVGTPEPHAEDISSTLVGLRSLLDRLPDTDADGPVELHGLDKLDDRIDDIQDRLDALEEEIDDLESDKEDKKELKNLLKAIKRLELNLDAFRDYDSLDIHLGRVDDPGIEDELPEGRYELHQDGKDIALFVDASADIGAVLNDHSFQPREIIPLIEREGSVKDELQSLKQDIDEIEAGIRANREEIHTVAEEHRQYLETNETELAEELEKAEAPLRFATSDNAFIAEGWVPADTFRAVKEELEDGSDNTVHVQREEAEKTPPVEHDNPSPIDEFETLTDLVSVPKYDEIDPTFMLFLTFPLFFGFMIGDAGYGLTSGIVFYLAMRMFPGARDVFKSLLFASAATFVFGLAFGDAFGFIIFGEDSVLTALTGLEVFSQIPILFHRSYHWSQVFMMAAIIGVAHINLGYILGMVNEYNHHGLLEAIMAKGSWIGIQIGALAWVLYGTTVGAPILAASVLLLAKGEGIEGIVEIPSLLSNILSYLRIFGVAVAAYALAQVVNSLASPLYATGTLIGLMGGTVILMIGHGMNTFIKIMEGFLQGIRLHYVEMFMKFFDGGGRTYRPFGRDNA